MTLDSLSQWGERYTRAWRYIIAKSNLKFILFDTHSRTAFVCAVLADLLGIFVCQRVDYFGKYLGGGRATGLKCEKRADSGPLDCTMSEEKRFLERCKKKFSFELYREKNSESFSQKPYLFVYDDRNLD